MNIILSLRKVNNSSELWIDFYRLPFSFAFRFHTTSTSSIYCERRYSSLLELSNEALLLITFSNVVHISSEKVNVQKPNVDLFFCVEIENRPIDIHNSGATKISKDKYLRTVFVWIVRKINDKYKSPNVSISQRIRSH